MLIPVRDLQLIAEGRITVAFRRWVRPTVRSGGTLRTPVGVLAIDAVEPVTEAEITAADAAAAGFPDLEALGAALASRSEGSLFRIRLHLEGADPRLELRGQAELSPQEVASIRAALGRLDARSKHGAWTARALAAIRTQPGGRAADLALALGVEKDWLKGNIRKLKELGLTESLEVGYRLSPRGEAFVVSTAGAAR
jgi:hypothetical protein